MPAIRRTEADLVLAGRYRLENLIARGGMAEVWRGNDAVLGRAVAVKTLLPHLAADASFLTRFRREAIAAARLSHPNIVATYDTGVDDGLAYIVMELVDGQTVRDALAAPGGLSMGQCVRITAEVAEALQYAHRSGVIHRDVKPANILLCGDGRVKVADFGIAKAVLAEDGADQDLTQTGAILGTAKYLSPEQVDGRSSDGRSDVYALGIVLYEMLCGRAPFTGETDMAVGAQHLSAPPPPLRRFRPDLPPALEQVVLRALAKDPDERFPSAAAMAEALEGLVLDPEEAATVAVRTQPTGNDDTPAQAAAPPTAVGSSWTSGPPAARPQPGAARLSFFGAERSWLIPGVIIVVVALAVGVTAAFLGRSGGGGPSEPSEPSGASAAPLRIVDTESFDPGGDGAEHEDELVNLTDGDPSTTWETQQYASSRFGNLKEGVGVVLRLDRAHPLKELRVSSPSRGWSAEVAAAESAGSDRRAWGEALDRATVQSGETTFDLGGHNARYLLLWITDLGGNQGSIRIGELAVS